jgi:type IV secretion system protein TrbL
MKLFFCFVISSLLVFCLTAKAEDNQANPSGSAIENPDGSDFEDTKDNILDGVADRFKDSVERASDVVTPIALELFGLLALIDLVWTFGMMMLRQGNLQDLITNLVKKTIFFSFFLAFLNNSKDWSYYIVDRFREMSNLVGQGMGGINAISPSNIFDIGLRISGKIIKTVNFMHPGDSLGIFISGLLLFLCFTVISGLLLLAIVEIYFAINIGVIFLGFGGSSWTSSYAKNYITYIVGLSVKIFVMQIIIGVGEILINDSVKDFGTSNSNVFVMIGTAIVILMLVKSIPDSLKSIISSIGSHNSDIIGTGVAAATGAASGSFMAAKAGLGFGAVANQAMKYGVTTQGKDHPFKAAGAAAQSMAKHGAAELKGHFQNRSPVYKGFSSVADKIKEDRMAHGKNNISPGGQESEGKS